MTPEKLGSLIGGVFGLIFVLVNTGSLTTELAWLVRGLGVAAFVAVLIAIRRPAAAESGRRPRGGFGRGYWLVVAAEVVAIWVGLALLNGPLDAPQAAVAWISLVVGVHFFALAAVWRESLFHWLGAGLTLCGVAGLVLALAGARASWIDIVGGVLPGALLLGFALWGSTRPARAATSEVRVGDPARAPVR